MTHTQYVEYLNSEAWREKRKASIDLAGGRCRVCNGTERLEVHHREYSRLGREWPSDLTVLCANCHKLFHRSRRLPRYVARKRDKRGRFA